MEVDSNGTKRWYLNDKLHCKDGPAIEYPDGTKEWWLNGKLHREDGPAREWGDEHKEWYLNGKIYTEKMYYSKMKKKIKEKIGAEVAEMFGFDKKYSWKRLWNRMETRSLADFLEEQGDLKTANQIRNLIKFALC